MAPMNLAHERFTSLQRLQRPGSACLMQLFRSGRTCTVRKQKRQVREPGHLCHSLRRSPPDHAHAHRDYLHNSNIPPTPCCNTNDPSDNAAESFIVFASCRSAFKALPLAAPLAVPGPDQQARQQAQRYHPASLLCMARMGTLS